MKQNNVTVIGAGLAGCEAAYQLIKRGVRVTLIEMKPDKKTPAHSSDGFAELVCSNSLRSDRVENAAGLLKQELRLLDSLIMRAADATSVPAGGALAVDRHAFSEYITNELRNSDMAEVISREVTSLSNIEGICIVATGPLTSDALYEDIRRVTGSDGLFFFDAASPIVTGDSIDMTSAFCASRYDRGSDYINCPLSAEEYDAFYKALITAECAQEKDFEKHVFEGCMPVEAMAMRGPKTLLFGPMKPVGLTDPATGRRPFAALQLRSEDAEHRLYNLVGFQTHLKFPEQRRVFSMIPALKNAEFVRYGVMHRNTYLNSPRLLDERYRLKSDPRLFFAGQMTGVEGYVESAASGLLAGIYAAHDALGTECGVFPTSTCVGALAGHISSCRSGNFQPMNINFGIVDGCGTEIRDRQKRTEYIIDRALGEIGRMKA